MRCPPADPDRVLRPEFDTGAARGVRRRMRRGGTATRTGRVPVVVNIGMLHYLFQVPVKDKDMTIRISHCRTSAVGAALLALLLTAGCAQTVTLPENTAGAAQTPADPVEPPLLADALRPDHPASYTIQVGDNHYDVSSRFLNEPWRWPGLWDDRGVPQLYPGNVLQLSAGAGGQPQLAVDRGGRPTIKLSPQIRVSEATAAIPTISSIAIAPFLNNAVVLTEAQWKSAPYILGNAENNIVATVGQRVYARGGDFDLSNYRIYRPGEAMREPGTGESLGYTMTYIGEAVLEIDGDPAQLVLIDAERGVRPGDRLLPVDREPVSVDFMPRSVPPDTDGVVMVALDNTLAIGRYNNVAVNLGAYDGMQPGHVLAIYQDGATVVDPVTGERIQQPETQAGILMLYKIFDLISYGLVVHADRDLRLGDRVGEP